MTTTIPSATSSKSSLFKKTLISQAVILASAGLYTSSASALAPCPPIVADGDVVFGCTLELDEGVTVQTGGAVIGSFFTPAIFISNSNNVQINNSGDISANDSFFSSALAIAIFNDGNFNGTITNTSNGTISADAQAFGTVAAAEAAAITNFGDFTKGIDNGGTISATASATGSFFASAFAGAIFNFGDFNGAIDNSGFIGAEALALGTSAIVFGGAIAILNVGDFTGDITNSGAIQADTVVVGAFDVDAFAAAILNGAGDFTGDINNSSMIGAYAEAFGVASVTALATAIANDAGDFIGNIVNNSGEITAEANAEAVDFFGDANAFATAISNFDGNFDGKVDNSSTIGAYADATGGIGGINTAGASAVATAIYNGVDFNGGIDNSGAIEADASVLGEAVLVAEAVAIFNANDFNSDIYNSGAITANAEAEGSVDLTASAAAIVNRGVFAGNIDNNGEINAYAKAAGIDFVEASATAIHNELSDFDGTITNSDTIEAYATAAADSLFAIASAAAIHNESGDFNGDVANSGAIKARAEATGADFVGAFTAAIRNEFGDFDGAITNSDVIEAYATATADSFFAAASAVAIHNQSGDFDFNGDIDNSHTINAHASASGTSSVIAEATAILNAGDFNADIINSGAIEAYAQTIGSAGTIAGITVGAFATAIANEGDFKGNIDNSGAINATAHASVATAFAILNEGNFDGGVDNTGTIAAKVTNNNATAADIFAGAVYIGDTLTGTLSNSDSGEIIARAHATTGNVFANGVFIDTISDADLADDDEYVGLINDGLISATAGAADTVAMIAEATARAVRINTLDAENALVNNGDIRATVSNASKASAVGLLIEIIAESAALTNNGAIVATANNGDVEAYGIKIHSDSVIEGSLINQHTISASADGQEEGYGHAYAIKVDKEDDNASIAASGHVINDGTLSVVANGIAGAGTFSDNHGYGMRIEGPVDGVVENNGEVNVTVEGESRANAAGIFIGDLDDSGSGQINGSLINTDDITVTATQTVADSNSLATTAVSNAVHALGIYVDAISDGGEVSNSGDISVTSAGSASTYTSTNTLAFAAGAAGLYVGELQAGATFTNSGMVTAAAEGTVEKAYALYIHEGDGNFTNEKSGKLYGGVFTGENADGAVDVINHGIIRPTLGQTVEILGDYTETSSGVTAIEAISADDDGYSRWVVGGTLTGSDLQVDVLSGADLEVGDILVDVLAADTIAGDWGDWVVFDGLRNDFAVFINNASTALSLILEERYTFLDIVDTTNLTYARGAAEALDQIDAAGTDAGTDMAGVIEALDDLPSFNDAARAIAQFTPITEVAWYTIQLAEQVSDAINDRMSGLSSSSGYASGSAMPGNNHVWVKVLGTDTKQDNTDNLPGYDADSYGFALGFDTQAHDQQWLVGGAFAYTNAKLDANTISKNHVEMDGYQVAAYGNYRFNGASFIDLIALVGIGDNEGKRVINFDGLEDGPRQAKSSYDSWFTRLYAALGHDFLVPGSNLTLTPAVNLGYAYAEEDSYTEKGAGDLNLKVRSNDADALVLGVDALASWQLDPSMQLTANAGVGYDFLADKSHISASYVGFDGIVFVTPNIEPHEWVYRGGVGFEAAATDQLDIYINYEYQGRKDFDNHLLVGTLRYAF